MTRQVIMGDTGRDQRSTTTGLEASVEAALEGRGYEKRKWFGCPVYLVKGKMFAGVYRGSIFMRLDEPDRAELLDSHGEIRPFEPLPGRVMREYCAIPDTLCVRRPFLAEWLGRAHAYVGSLGPGKKDPPRYRRKRP